MGGGLANPATQAQDATDPAALPPPSPQMLALKVKACSGCHALPEPYMERRDAWERIILEMADLMIDQERYLSRQEIGALVTYYQAYAREELYRRPDNFLPCPLSFTKQTVGLEPGPRPQISNVNVTDLDQDGREDVLVCDNWFDRLTWLRRLEDGSWEETVLAELKAPVRTETFDFEGDGDLDIAVATMGFMWPNDELQGAAIVLVNDGEQHFEPKRLIGGVPRISDVQPADLDGDGDYDFVLAMFGWRTTGMLGWLEQVSPEKFQLHNMLRLNGVMRLETEDLDHDGRMDFVALVSQQHEMVLRCMNLGEGKFDIHLIGKADNPAYGSSGLTLVDLDQDGDTDILYSNGDNMDTGSTTKPYHGIQWLENDGNLNFRLRDICRYHSCYRALARDMDGDGDLDIVASNMYFDWETHDLPSLIFLENDGQENFTRKKISYDPTNLATFDLADFNGDGLPDIVAGGMYLQDPKDRWARLSVWMQEPSGETAAARAPAPAQDAGTAEKRP